MNVIVLNLINEIKDIKKEVFTKDEIIKLLNEINNDARLPIVESNGITVNPESFNVEIKGEKINIPNRMFHLLHYFISNKNKNLTRNQIIRDVWGNEICVIDKTIDVHVRKLRTLLPNNYIITTKGIGYRWEEK